MSAWVFTAVLRNEEDLYVAECPEVGTVSQGYTIEEAVANLREATELYLDEFPLEESPHPILSTEGVVGCVVPLHPELAEGTRRGVLRQARVSAEDFLDHL
jgi:predicted RNase H-like HicB family nuclease